jgi:uncharacterized membrane protein
MMGKKWKSCSENWNIREKIESAFFYGIFVIIEDHNSGLERWICVILFFFCSLGLGKVFKKKKNRNNYTDKPIWQIFF